jgi:hypothetical protein
LKDYEATKENDDKIAAYFKAHQLELSYANLEKAFRELKAQGVSFVPEEVEEPLPEVPGMGEPQIFTMSDVNAMSPERKRKLMRGQFGEQFAARVVEIHRRAKEAARKEAEGK